MKKIKIHCCSVVCYNNYIQKESETIIFSSEKQADNYIDFMNKYDGDTKAGYYSYEKRKQVVYLSEDFLIIKHLERECRQIKNKLKKLKDKDGNIPTYGYDLIIYKEYLEKLKEKEELLKSYKEKTMNNNDKENDLEM